MTSHSCGFQPTALCLVLSICVIGGNWWLCLRGVFAMKDRGQLRTKQKDQTRYVAPRQNRNNSAD